MEIEKILTVAAPAARVWTMLLDPHVMGGCVPGMQSIEVVSDDEYIAHMQVKISFINARFKLKTRIVERREPHYLRSEGTGEDSSVASSLKQQSEVFLMEQPDGQTELRMKVKLDLMGRLGTFGLSVMKTKADRMWDEFAHNLALRLTTGDTPPAAAAALKDAAALPELRQLENALGPVGATATRRAPTQPAPRVPHDPGAIGVQDLVRASNRNAGSPQVVVTDMPALVVAKQANTWWSRLLMGSPRAVNAGRNIHIEMRNGDTLLSVDWPLEGAKECAAWLQASFPARHESSEGKGSAPTG